MKKEILLVVILAIIIIALIGILLWPKQNEPQNNTTDDLRSLSVKENQEITTPLTIEGEVKGTWFFEASFPIKITDENGNVLGSSYVQAQSDWMTENFVPFKGEISYQSKTAGKGFLVFMKDNPSGLPQYDKEFRLPVLLGKTETIKIKAYFNNSNMDPEFSCNKVFPVEREIAKTEGIAKAAVEELLKGPTNTEKEQGFLTSINQGVEIQSLIIENGAAKIDFNDQLEFQVGGSCRVSAIRAQITETLKQFSTAKNVVISINGRVEDILQP